MKAQRLVTGKNRIIRRPLNFINVTYDLLSHLLDCQIVKVKRERVYRQFYWLYMYKKPYMHELTQRHVDG